jgi:type IX secretion system PorP/SprF family membrane protein
MNMKKQLTISLTVALIICASRIQAQDFHLSQYDAFALYLNPALTGQFQAEKADYRAGTIYRTQWRSMTRKPFATYGLFYDMPYKRFGIGAYLLNNRAGIANFNTLNFQVSGSYFITDPAKSPHILNVGLQLGLFYKTFNPNNVLFESQYDNATGSLSSEINSGENFEKTSLVKFDANMGVFYQYKEQDKKYSPYVGFSVFHLSKPSESFSAEKSRTPIRFCANAGSSFVVSEKVTVTPNVLYMNQAKATELNVGIAGTYELKEKTDILYGVNYRLKDALIIHAGLKKDNIVFRMSYDINVSYLSAYTHNRGAFEISLVVHGKKHENPFKSIASF